MTAEVRFHRITTVLLTAALLATLTVALTGGQPAEAIDGPVEVVYIATGRNFPDALAGSTLAATAGAPLLTVEPNLPLPDTTITALQSLDPDRIEGTDRHDTAAQIADALPDKVHDADRLDGLDSSAFLRTDAPMGAVYGSRARQIEGSPVQTTSTAVQTLEFTAPSDGILQVNASVYLSNTDSSQHSVVTYLLYDWDSDPSASSRLAHAIADDEVGLPQNEDDTSALTTAVPVTAGDHTIHFTVGGDTEVTYDLASVSAVFSPSGAASPVGIELP